MDQIRNLETGCTSRLGSVGYDFSLGVFVIRNLETGCISRLVRTFADAQTCENWSSLLVVRGERSTIKQNVQFTETNIWEGTTDLNLSPVIGRDRDVDQSCRAKIQVKLIFILSLVSIEHMLPPLTNTSWCYFYFHFGEWRGAMVRAWGFSNFAARRAVSNPAWRRIFR